MKIGITVSLTLAAAATLAISAPASAQSRHGGGGGTVTNRGGGGTVANRGVGNHGRFFYRGRWYSGSRFNFYFGGFGYPFYGYPYGYPYYGYPYGYYGYAPYGGYSGPGYAPGSNGVYEGRAVGRTTNDHGDAKDSGTAQVQRHLSQAGYYHGSIDGVAGDGTRRAIRNYQRDNGLPVTGRIDGDLLGALGVS